MLYWIGIPILLNPVTKRSREFGRKLTHIFVHSWWFLSLILFDNFWYAVAIPAFYVIIGTIFALMKEPPSFLSDVERENEVGSFKFSYIASPLSIVVVIFFQYFIFKNEYLAGFAVLALSFGDAAAALVGSKFKFGEYRIGKHVKTLAGSLSMFITTFLLCILYSYIIGFSLDIMVFCIIISIIATVTEAVSVRGLDNITIPTVCCAFTWICANNLWI
ncbi:diacylglycerol/polyprenol kinase family protein [Cohnella abietis]|uniref:diacylglycerol/polyprenol kinase family protein n=1 Tax=Cohnella abietis TaxID=2507935 RepID=UPI00102E89A7|nr:hypothetical protein [Cohnella abietis]